MTAFFLFYENKNLRLELNKSYVIGRDPSCDIVLQDRHVSRRHACLSYKTDGFVLTDLQSSNGSFVGGQKIQEQAIQENVSFRISECNLSIRAVDDGTSHELLEMGDTMLFENKVATIIDKVKDPALTKEINTLRQLYNRKKEDLAQIAFHDTLTKLFNRRFFDSKLIDEITRAIRYRHPLALLMIDIDHFKKFNDSYGHQKGDEVLVVVADIIAKTLRSEDIVCRYGGEEIVVILPETPGKHACKAAESCRANVEQMSALHAGVTITISIGVAELAGETSNPESLIKAADKALYAAKKGGRNRFVF